MENPLKSYDFSGFSGPSDWFRTSGLVVPNHALCHLSYTRNCGIIITDMAGKSKGKIRGREILNPLGGFRRSVQSGIMSEKNSAKELSP